MKFRAGVRRPHKFPMTTEYQTHFTWKRLVPTPPSSRVSDRQQDGRSSEGGAGGPSYTQEMTPIGKRLCTLYREWRWGGGVGGKMVITAKLYFCRSEAGNRWGW